MSEHTQTPDHCHGQECGIRVGDRVDMTPGDVTGLVTGEGGWAEHELQVRLLTSGAVVYVHCRRARPSTSA